MFDKKKRFEFRGYDKDLKKWFYGGYIIKADYADSPFEKPGTKPAPVKHFIVFEEMVDWGLPTKLKVSSVDKDSVGQCTGEKDMRGNFIYEGDIIKDYRLDRTLVIKFDKGKFIAFDKEIGTGVTLEILSEAKEVVGNKYENSELIRR